MKPAIVVHGVGKRYYLRDTNGPTSLKDFFVSGRRGKPPEVFWSLRNVSVTISPGHAVGVVGLNGAGKSTLLRLIGGVGRPDEGRISVQGRIGALLDIGAGLTEDLSGRENVFLLGVIAGMRRAEIRGRFDDIVSFAELEDAIESPVRTYSTGMRMRLAFAVAVHVNPDIFLIDEALAVGDGAFQEKCIRRVQDIRAGGATIFLVSHDLGQIEAVCDHVLFLSKGQVVAYGPLEETLALYRTSIEQKISDTPYTLPATTGLIPQVNRFGTGAMLIRSVMTADARGGQTTTIHPGDALTVRLQCENVAGVADPIVLVAIYAAAEVCVFESWVPLAEVSPREPTDGSVELALDRLDLAPGSYRVTAGLFSGDWATAYDYHAEVYPLDVLGTPPSKGFLDPPKRWRQNPGNLPHG